MTTHLAGRSATLSTASDWAESENLPVPFVVNKIIFVITSNKDINAGN